MKIVVCGDTHGDWGPLNTLINKTQPNILFVCGDFGWWVHCHNSTEFSGNGKPWNQFGVKLPINTKLFWCDGNHENFDDIEARCKEHGTCEPFEFEPEKMPGVFYCPRGSVVELPDGRNVLFMGGAESIDKARRIQGMSWWPQETITQSDLNDLPDCKIDIVISHTVPMKFIEHPGFSLGRNDPWLANIIRDPSVRALDAIFDQYKPKQWFAGHWHHYMFGNTEGCDWKVLGYVGGSQKNWIELN